LFFDETGTAGQPLVSYGHDIEAAWLLQEAAMVIKHEPIDRKLKKSA
jgi:mannobiose 2-epimerase